MSIRYPASLVEPRVEALLPCIQERHEAIRMSRSKVLLMALLEGLDVLEQRYLSGA